MRFSRRTSWDRTPNEIARLLEGRDDALDLTESNPTRAGLAADPGELAAALADPGNVRYEPEALGLRGAREALAAWLERRGTPVDPGRIVLTASTSEAYAYVFKLACDPGDAVMVPTPSYPLFDFLTRLEDVEVAPYRLKLRERWELDVDALAAAMPERARAVLVVSPNNPTGSLLRPGEAGALAHLARERELVVVSDEVFADFAWDDGVEPGRVLDACAREGALGVVMSGLSKACGLPQLKLGWMLLGGPDALVEEARARLELVADTYLSVATPVQRGLPRLLRMGDAFRARLRPRLATNLGLLRLAAGACGARLLPADGGWYGVLALPESAPSEQAVVDDLLRHDGVFVHPGWLFDLPVPSLVVSLLTETPRLEQGLEKIVERVARR